MKKLVLFLTAIALLAGCSKGAGRMTVEPSVIKVSADACVKKADTSIPCFLGQIYLPETDPNGENTVFDSPFAGIGFSNGQNDWIKVETDGTSVNVHIAKNDTHTKRSASIRLSSHRGDNGCFLSIEQDK